MRQVWNKYEALSRVHCTPHFSRCVRRYTSCQANRIGLRCLAYVCIIYAVANLATNLGYAFAHGQVPREQISPNIGGT